MILIYAKINLKLFLLPLLHFQAYNRVTINNLRNKNPDEKCSPEILVLNRDLIIILDCL
jgi:hypothetical protein